MGKGRQRLTRGANYENREDGDNSSVVVPQHGGSPRKDGFTEYVLIEASQHGDGYRKSTPTITRVTIATTVVTTLMRWDDHIEVLDELNNCANC